MTDIRTRYLSCWNETDPVARQRLLSQGWTESAGYTDPLVEANGLQQIDATIAAVQAQFPSFAFSPVGDIDAHHQLARFSWGLGPADAEPVIVGSDVVVTDTDGRIATVLGFLDKVPS
ncbi:MAG: nuclear transport factor 2 family protein [Actinomycetota bacterium]|nr:nuclear transport factor 2 family protein [Actinomycetota bacterium]